MKDSKSFEQALKKLETITTRLENEDLTLTESVSLFEEGVTLVNALQKRLNEAERKVEILIKEADEKFRLEKFEEEEEDLEEDDENEDREEGN